MSYLTRILLMTLLASDTTEAILNDRQGDGIGLSVLAKPFPTDW